MYSEKLFFLLQIFEVLPPLKKGYVLLLVKKAIVVE